jgi:hypothetical protein
MTFQYKLPNSLKEKPHVGFQLDVDEEVKSYLKVLGEREERSKFINEAINMRFRYEFYKKGFLLEMVKMNFELVKYLCRQVGKTMSQVSDTSK